MQFQKAFENHLTTFCTSGTDADGEVGNPLLLPFIPILIEVVTGILGQCGAMQSPHRMAERMRTPTPFRRARIMIALMNDRTVPYRLRRGAIDAICHVMETATENEAVGLVVELSDDGPIPPVPGTDFTGF